jgi:hypothetical protein
MRGYFSTVAAALDLFLGLPDGGRADFIYPDFSSTAHLRLNGDAAQSGNRLRLTSTTGSQHGSAWFKDQQSIQSGFLTTFQFQITNPGGVVDPSGRAGGDGFTFAIQNSGATALGGRGVGLGYADAPDYGDHGIPKSLVIEFDTWQDLIFGVGDPNGNHISVHTRGRQPNSPLEIFSLRSTTHIPDMTDGNIHTVEIIYQVGKLSVFMDDLMTPRLMARVDLADILPLKGGQAWVGFTAATGSAVENHDLLNWSFGEASAGEASAVVPEPSTLSLLVLGTVVGMIGKAWERSARKPNNHRLGELVSSRSP